MTIRITASRHSAFYTPLLSTMAAGFLEKHGLSYTYGVLAPGETAAGLIRDGKVDVMQSAPSTNWAKMDKGETGFPLHFGLINQRDGFFLVGRKKSFDWERSGRQRGTACRPWIPASRHAALRNPLQRCRLAEDQMWQCWFARRNGRLIPRWERRFRASAGARPANAGRSRRRMHSGIGRRFDAGERIQHSLARRVSLFAARLFGPSWKAFSEAKEWVRL